VHIEVHAKEVFMPSMPEPITSRLEALLDRSILDARGRSWTASELLQILERVDITAYVTGGAVRDAIRGRPIRDLDFVTDGHIATTASHLRDLCGPETITIYNEAVGSLRLGSSGQHFDIGMFRDIESIEGHRSLTTVCWQLGDVDSDARTTDFTINALYWRPDTGIVDPTKRGVADCIDGRLELSSDPRKTAIDQRLSLRLALFVARGFEPTAASLRFFEERIDRDVERLGPKLPAFLDELTGAESAWKEGVIAFAKRGRASEQTLRRLAQAAATPPESYDSYWSTNANFA
jgi:poly(A) polymerase